MLGVDAVELTDDLVEILDPGVLAAARHVQRTSNGLGLGNHGHTVLPGDAERDFVVLPSDLAADGRLARFVAGWIPSPVPPARPRCHDCGMTKRPLARWVRVTLDCHDAESLGAFYADLFGWQINARDGGGWVQVRAPDGGVGLNFQAAPDYVPPTWPEKPSEQSKMMHFEVLVHDLGAAVGAVLRAGGTEAAFQPPDRDQSRLRVMLDPAGHPFCLFMEGE